MKKLLLILLLSSFKIYAQGVANDSVIYLKTPEKGGKKVKTETLKTTGEELAAHAFTAIAEQVSLIKDIPAGQFTTLTFYFNSGLINLSKKEFNIEYKDTTLALKLYEVGADGKPGKLLIDTPLYFVVAKDHKGALELDVSALNLQTQPQLFIGMASADGHTGEQVILKVRENKNALSYTKAKGSHDWVEYDDGSGLKFDIKMRVEVAIPK
jgi:hypothetical protein